jgi:hypothetical protein
LAKTFHQKAGMITDKNVRICFTIFGTLLELTLVCLLCEKSTESTVGMAFPTATHLLAMFTWKMDFCFTFTFEMDR